MALARGLYWVSKEKTNKIRIVSRLTKRIAFSSASDTQKNRSYLVLLAAKWQAYPADPAHQETRIFHTGYYSGQEYQSEVRVCRKIISNWLKPNGSRARRGLLHTIMLIRDSAKKVSVLTSLYSVRRFRQPESLSSRTGTVVFPGPSLVPRTLCRTRFVLRTC